MIAARAAGGSPELAGLGRHRAWVIAWLAVGIAWRLAVALPAHKYAADADMVVNALCAFRVERGEFPIFAVGERIGSLGCHGTALLFSIFGPTRTALAIGPAIAGCLLLPIWYLFLRQLLGPGIALWCLPFVAIPSPAYTFWSYLPNSYPETLLLCGLTLWLAARLAAGDERRRVVFGLGLAVGLGWWNSMQTVGCTAPALLWLAWRRPHLLRRRAFLVLVAAGAAFGASPWLLHNIRHPLGSFRGNFATRATPGLAAKIDNARYLMSYSLPELVAGPGQPREVSPRIQGFLRRPMLLFVFAAVLFFWLAPALRRWLQPPAALAGARAPPWVLLALVFATMLALNVFSEAGQTRGLTVRYILPLYLVVPAQLGLFLAWLGARSRAVAAALAATLLLLYGAGTALPGTDLRQKWSREAGQDARLVAALSELEVEAVLGPFWEVYPLSFLSREAIIGIPFQPSLDLAHMARRLPEAGARWALIGRREEPLAACARSTRLQGRLSQLNADFWGFIVATDPGQTSRDFLRQIRASCLDRAWRRWRRAPTPHPDPSTIFVDGFDSGALSDWSSVVSR